ncbi:MAG: zinc metallopeptidase [Christensenellales bacterium]
MFYPYGFYFDPTMLIVLPGLLLALWAQFKVNSTYSKYSRVESRSGLTAAQAARMLLDENGLSSVRIERVRGRLTDNYDPRDKVLRLSDDVMNSTSIAALGVAAHEAGHAVQDAQGYKPLMLRSAMVPVVSVGSNLAIPLFFLGLIFSWEPLVNVGIILFGLVVVFSLVTLPVEFNASKRALATLEGCAILDSDELSGARAVLGAAAMTYVASALQSILNLLRLVVISGRGDRRD